VFFQRLQRHLGIRPREARTTIRAERADAAPAAGLADTERGEILTPAMPSVDPKGQPVEPAINHNRSGGSACDTTSRTGSDRGAGAAGLTPARGQ
jgi:hypothetical protein